MASTGIDSVSEDIKTKLLELDEADQESFLKDKAAYTERSIDDSPLLDQLCWVRLIQARLAEAFTEVLSSYKSRLEGKTRKLGRWRRSPTTKAPDEFESPMPWLHPYKLASEALLPLTESLEASVTSGETTAQELALLNEVCDQHDIQFPLSSQTLRPKYPPRPLKMYD